VPCFATPVVGLLLAAANYPVRKALKAKYGITQDPGCCPDCGLVTFCELCILCQEARQRCHLSLTPHVHLLLA